MTPLTGSPVAQGSATDNPNPIVVDPSGKYVYVGNNFGNITGYNIDSVTGELTALAGFPITSSRVVHCFAFNQAGTYLYAAGFAPSYADSNIMVFSVNSGTGALTEITGSPFMTGQGAEQLVIDPSGKYLYATNCYDDGVSAYIINASTGALTEIAGSPYATGDWPNGIAIDPTGKFLYVTNAFGSNISAYSINASDGTLTETVDSPFTAGANPYYIKFVDKRQ